MEKRTALITGITGQDGRILGDFLNKKGYEVYGLVRRVVGRDKLYEYDGLWGGLWNPFEYAHIIEGDIRTVKFPPDQKFDEVYHLAAQSHVGYSFAQPAEIYDTNILGTENMLRQTLSNKPDTKFYFAGTSEMFGMAKTKTQNEKTPFAPQSPYAISKVAGYYMAMHYRNLGHFVSCGITMNHESEIRGEEFVTRKITKGIAEYVLHQTPFTLGNLYATRDWGYAPDFVDGFWRTLQHDTPDTYVFGTGEMHTVFEFLTEALRNAAMMTDSIPSIPIDLMIKGMPLHKVSPMPQGVADRASQISTVTTVPPVVEITNSNMRPREAGNFCANYSKAKRVLKWKPEVKFNRLVEIMVANDLVSVGIDAHTCQNR